MNRRGAPHVRAVDEALEAAGLVRPAVAAKELGIKPALLRRYRTSLDSETVEVDGKRHRGIKRAQVDRLRAVFAIEDVIE